MKTSRIKHSRGRPFGSRRSERLTAMYKNYQPDHQPNNNLSAVPPIKRGRGRSRGTKKWQEKGVQLQMSVQTGGDTPPVQLPLIGDECSPFSDQLLPPEHDMEQPASEVHTLQNNADQILELNAMESTIREVVPEDGTLRRCSSLEIIQIDSTAENSSFLPTCSAPLKEDNEIVSRAIVEDELLDTTSHEDHHCGLESSRDAKAKEGQCQSIASEHRNECCNEGADSSDMRKDSCHLLQAIIIKHGVISKDCMFESEFFKTKCLEGISWVFQKLQDTRFVDLNNIDELQEFYLIVKDANRVGLDVKWLHQRLDEISESMSSRDELVRLEQTEGEITLHKEAAGKAIEMKRAEVQILENEIQGMEKEQASEKLRIEELKAQIKDIKSTCRLFDNLLDELF